MSFDPSKVERWKCCETIGRVDVVNASDYDALYELYKVAKLALDGACGVSNLNAESMIEWAKWSGNRIESQSTKPA
jgi:hypothetical protein